MSLILMMVAAAIVGYLVPVLASLFFSMTMGRVAPRMVSRGGRIRVGFVVLHGLVWGLAAAGSGFLIGMIVPQNRWIACLAAGVLLVGALLSNVGEMKKMQGPVRVGGMVLATVAGLAGGLVIYSRVMPPTGV